MTKCIVINLLKEEIKNPISMDQQVEYKRSLI